MTATPRTPHRHTASRRVPPQIPTGGLPKGLPTRNASLKLARLNG